MSPYVTIRKEQIYSSGFGFCLFQEAGDLLFGVSYLPTAQRLSISVIKASNLKYLQIVDSIANFS
jgi:hypothetical protein